MRELAFTFNQGFECNLNTLSDLFGRSAYTLAAGATGWKVSKVIAPLLSMASNLGLVRIPFLHREAL
jgi:hypothetical protein